MPGICTPSGTSNLIWRIVFLISGVSQFVMAAVTFMNHVELPRVPVLIFVNDAPFDALFFCLNQILISILPLKRAVRQVPASLKSWLQYPMYRHICRSIFLLFASRPDVSESTRWMVAPIRSHVGQHSYLSQHWKPNNHNLRLASIYFEYVLRSWTGQPYPKRAWSRFCNNYIEVFNIVLV